MASGQRARAKIIKTGFRFRLIVIGLLIATLLYSCTNYVQNADSAYMRGDWDGAVRDYSRALSVSKDPLEIQYIQSNLTAAKHKAATEHSNRANQLEALGEISKAYQHAERAFGYKPDDQTTLLFHRLKNKEFERLENLGRASLDSDSWNSAIDYLQQAKAIRHDDQLNDLIWLAELGRVKEHNEKFSLYYQSASIAREARNWNLAMQEYEAAHQFGSSTSSKNESDFVHLVAEAEKYLSRSSTVYFVDKAEEKLREALAYELDSDYIKQRIDSIKLRDYRITIHSAVILPFDPSDNSRWDGPNSPVDPIAELATIGAALYGIPPTYAKLGTSMLQISAESFRAPDPILIVSTEGKRYGGVDTLTNDQYRPQWDYSLTYFNINRHDKRVLSVSIVDHDLTDHDKIGDYQFVLGELVASPGVIEKVFVGEDQKLLAGGLAGLKLSVEEL